MNAIAWSLELPEHWTNFFTETGIVHSLNPEKSGKQRRIVRIRGFVFWEKMLPSVPRDQRPIGVYTKDFSKDACGLVAPLQLFPEERLRLLLPTFWLRLRVVRCVRQTASCFEVGLQLVSRHDPDSAAFMIGDESFLGSENAAKL